MTDAISRSAVHVVINSRVFDTEYPSEFDELKRLIDEIPTLKADGNTSDGYHTFNELYDHRAKLFSVIVRDHSDLCWKSKQHHDGTMYDGMFIVGINTPHGQASYHYDIDPYWDMFNCREMERAPEWDGHTPQQAIDRIAALDVAPVVHARWEMVDREAFWIGDDEIWKQTGKPTIRKMPVCSHCKTEFGIAVLKYKRCPECGAKMDGESDG